MRCPPFEYNWLPVLRRQSRICMSHFHHASVTDSLGLYAHYTAAGSDQVASSTCLMLRVSMQAQITYVQFARSKTGLRIASLCDSSRRPHPPRAGTGSSMVTVETARMNIMTRRRSNKARHQEMTDQRPRVRCSYTKQEISAQDLETKFMLYWM